MPLTAKTPHRKTPSKPDDALLDDAPALSVPLSAATLDGFIDWACSERFPKQWSASFIDNEIFLDISPEELETHARLNAEISRQIHTLVKTFDLGAFYPDRTLIANRAAGLSTEPDGTFVRWESFESKRVRRVASRKRDDRFMTLLGTPDWVMEIVSETSVAKDTKKLREAYHRAGVPEYWLIDARRAVVSFQILAYRRSGYVAVRPRRGWHRSKVFEREFRLRRERDRSGGWDYTLEIRKP
ncbi:MAG TPA: Uma2 family endonuclease [Pirellulales bacterium]|nr:Uma2 family endonuclease [Pirellulales bacterium]